MSGGILFKILILGINEMVLVFLLIFKMFFLIFYLQDQYFNKIITTYLMPILFYIL